MRPRSPHVRPSAVLIDLEGAHRRAPRGARAAVAVGIALGLVVGVAPSPAPLRVAAVRAIGAPHLDALGGAPARAATLALPVDLTDVDLVAFPDWLANEPPPARMRAIVAVRGTMGLASVDAPATINWTEDGVSYHLVSTRWSVADLVALAARLR